MSTSGFSGEADEMGSSTTSGSSDCPDSSSETYHTASEDLLSEAEFTEMNFEFETHCIQLRDTLLNFVRISTDHDSAYVPDQCLIFVVAYSGCHHTIYRLLFAGCSIHARNLKGQTALHIASQEGHLQAMDILIEYGILLDAQNVDGRTCLHIAVENGLVNVVEKLLNHRASRNLEDQDGRTAFHIACDMGNWEIAGMLGQGNVVSHIPRCCVYILLMYATTHGNLKELRLLLALTTPLNQQFMCALALLAMDEDNVNMLQEIVDCKFSGNLNAPCWRDVLKAAYRKGNYAAAMILGTRGV